MVEQNICRLLCESGKVNDFIPYELFVLSAAACCHDFDKAFDFGLRHGQGSEEFVRRHLADLNLSKPEAIAIGHIVRIHACTGQTCCDELAKLPSETSLANGPLTLRRLAVVMKAADVLHTDNSRTADIIAAETADTASKVLARTCISGWRIERNLCEPMRIVVDAQPSSDGQFAAVLKCQFLLYSDEWRPISDLLRDYGFPAQLEFHIEDRRPRRTVLPRDPSLDCEVAYTLRPNEEPTLVDIDRLLHGIQDHFRTSCPRKLVIRYQGSPIALSAVFGYGFLSEIPPLAGETK